MKWVHWDTSIIEAWSDSSLQMYHLPSNHKCHVGFKKPGQFQQNRKVMQRRSCLRLWWWQSFKLILHNTALECYFIDLILQLGLPEFCIPGPPLTEDQWGKYKLMLWHAAYQFTPIQWHLWDTEHRRCLRSYTPALMRRLRPCDHQHIHSSLAALELYCLHDPNSIFWLDILNKIENWNLK